MLCVRRKDNTARNTHERILKGRHELFGLADGARDAVHEDLSDLIQEHALPIEVAGLLSSALARELAGCILSGVSLTEVQEIYRELGREVDLYVERIAAFGAE